MSVRAHIVLPEDLLQEVDRYAGKRKRSHFMEEAVREKLFREALTAVLGDAAGSIDLTKHPEWETPEKTSAWVAASRREDDLRFKRQAGFGNQ